MKKPLVFAREFIKGKIITYHIRQDGSYYDERLKTLNHKKILSIRETSDLVQSTIRSGRPFMACRFGSIELATVKTFDFEYTRKYDEQKQRMHTFAGVFPETVETGKKFADLMIRKIPSADLVTIWPQAFEEYYLREYGSETVQYTMLPSLSPWLLPDNPWTAALAGKKVLVVHPFAESIVRQYQKRELIYPGTDILPAFSLEVMKSVQTAGGESDSRFQDWFEAYDYMREEILKRDFDVALLGCGAYGFPLAADIKDAGKQAFHIGGTVQILFGILGNRWNNDADVQKYVNEAWVRPLESEKPKDAQRIENACYW